MEPCLYTYSSQITDRRCHAYIVFAKGYNETRMYQERGYRPHCTPHDMRMSAAEQISYKMNSLFIGTIGLHIEIHSA